MKTNRLLLPLAALFALSQPLVPIRPALAAHAESGVTIRVTVPPDSRALVKELRIAGAYNGWKPPQPMTPRGDGVFEYRIANPDLAGHTVEYRLYPGGSGGWDGAEGPDSFKRTFLYSAGTQVLLKNVVFGAADGGVPAALPVTIDPTRAFQTIEGFGGALTDASAWLIGKAATPAQRDELLHTLFDSSTGAGLSYVRVPIGASDFSLTEHTYDDLPPGQTDYDLTHFSIAYDRAYILPVLHQALAINPRLKVMASPWSPPAWMKDSGRVNGGHLKSDAAAYRAYADYLLRFVQAYAAEGIPIDMLTLQNEPWNETGGYPSMRVEPADEIRLVRLLGPRFRAAHIATKIVVWDHNWDHPEYPEQVLADAEARPYIDGAAFHGYAGTVAAQHAFHAAEPTANIYFTESTGGTFATNFSSNLMWDMANLLVGSTRDWAKTVLKWNLVLDETNGPHVPGGPNNCRGILTFNRQTGAITREEEFYAFAHAARFVQPGAQVIYTDNPATVAFRNPDSSTALILYNAAYNTRTYRLQLGARGLAETVPPRSVVTLLWADAAASPVQSWLTTGDQTKLLERQTDAHF